MRRFTRNELHYIDEMVAKFVLDDPAHDSSFASEVLGLAPLEIQIPNFSTNIELAFAVVSFLEKNHYFVKIERALQYWEVTFRTFIRNGMILEHNAKSVELPSAICVAALRIVGIGKRNEKRGG